VTLLGRAGLGRTVHAPQRALDVVGMRLEGFGVPFAARRFEEVARSERFAFTLTANALASEVGTGVSTQGVFNGSVSIVALPMGIQWNPMKGEL
jgi:hypothetical protein